MFIWVFLQNGWDRGDPLVRAGHVVARKLEGTVQAVVSHEGPGHVARAFNLEALADSAHGLVGARCLMRPNEVVPDVRGTAVGSRVEQHFPVLLLISIGRGGRDRAKVGRLQHGAFHVVHELELAPAAHTGVRLLAFVAPVQSIDFKVPHVSLTFELLPILIKVTNELHV